MAKRHSLDSHATAQCHLAFGGDFKEINFWLDAHGHTVIEIVAGARMQFSVGAKSIHAFQGAIEIVGAHGVQCV